MALGNASVAVMVLTFYPWLRLSLFPWLDSIGGWAGPCVDALFASVGLWFLGERIWSTQAGAKVREITGWMATLGGLGFLFYRGALFLGLSVPFDLMDGSTILALVLMAPILEEALFRGVNGRALELLGVGRMGVIFCTTVIFAMAHLEASSRVGVDHRPFVFYQTLYVIPLSVACGVVRFRTDATLPAALVHFSFNLGFFLGGFVS